MAPRADAGNPQRRNPSDLWTKTICSMRCIVINNLGYRLSTEAWGKGLATEFAIYAIKFGFDVIKLTEISAVVRENHLASQKVLQKSGLRYVKEIHDVKDAPPSLLYSISVDEWLRNLEVNASV
ncbi:GNAT family N-acetyltransferase [Klebsiella pneumoniae]|uniref:GNAT family N-acetyltransferase n=1 Tax=Klebsiella pneumoniae TaxID=573 RepID=UPI001330AB9C|nr:GNAT family N-acetyltransferase [Klebsiella pneumoniae]HEO9103951.1 GNAT family N-acetyltransferase [Klebsiella pneumoniae subsp. pneumoniae]HBR7649136.1 GNAT family N-acetyltransferase [Klebsiella pneumoniae]HCR9800891.1 GNAT family N-acetyltransferase [Klebsiella pneumoniae]HDT1548589.1 GNAT family N-acetyltransferase [Klebsiella pneumoniae]